MVRKTFEENFFEKGWIDNVEVVRKTRAPYFMVNEDIIFHIMVLAREPVDRVRANIFHAEDRNLFEDPPKEQLNYPDKNLPGFDSKGRILGIDLEPSSDDCEICGYSVWTEPRYFDKSGKYFIHIGALQNNIPTNWTSTRTLVDLKSEEEVLQLQFNQNITKKIENIDESFDQSEFWTKGFGLLGIGFAIVGIGITFYITGRSRENIVTIQQEENEYRYLQSQKTDLLFRLNEINREIDNSSGSSDPEIAEIEHDLMNETQKIQKNIYEINQKMTKFRKK